MSDADLVVVHTFGSRSEADLAKSALEAAGIDAIIRGDSAGGQYPGVAAAHGFAASSQSDGPPTPHHGALGGGTRFFVACSNA